MAACVSGGHSAFATASGCNLDEKRVRWFDLADFQPAAAGHE
jgi:hypothetical protein